MGSSFFGELYCDVCEVVFATDAQFRAKVRNTAFAASQQRMAIKERVKGADFLKDFRVRHRIPMFEAC